MPGPTVTVDRTHKEADMPAQHDRDEERSADLANDLALPDAVAEETVGGDTILRQIPGTLKWQNVSLKIGVTTDLND